MTLNILKLFSKVEQSTEYLLIMDGYDEYKPGTNRDIDRVIESSIGNYFLILTSRPDLPSNEGQYVSKEIRDRMDGEIMIEGFTEESIQKCSAQYLESEEQSDTMLAQAVNAGIEGLLKVPIVLLMVCVLFYENATLPQTWTKIVRQIFELTVEENNSEAAGTERGFGRFVAFSWRTVLESSPKRCSTATLTKGKAHYLYSLQIFLKL